MEREETGLLIRREAVIRRLLECGHSMAALRRIPKGRVSRFFWGLVCKRRRERAYHELGQEVAVLRRELLEIETHIRKYHSKFPR